MISTKIIKSISSKLPKNSGDNIYVNVLTWHNESHSNGSIYHVFSPYYLKTDGKEIQHNNGNVLFENFWQGSKVWPTFYDCEIWAHHTLKGNEKYLWFKYRCSNGRRNEPHIKDNNIEPDYYKWRDEIFKCKKPIRYPNGHARRSKVAFSLLIDQDGTEKRLSYIEARKEIYIKEYCRLIRKLAEYNQLLQFLKQGKHLIICEIDVLENETITIEKLENLVNNKNIRFGHGFCLAWALLEDYKKINNTE